MGIVPIKISFIHYSPFGHDKITTDMEANAHETIVEQMERSPSGIRTASYFNSLLVPDRQSSQCAVHPARYFG
jgi:hypothetical protein